MPTKVPSEPQGLRLFQVVLGGIGFTLGLAFSGPPAKRILTLDLIVPRPIHDSIVENLEWTVRARNGYVAQFSFFGSNVSPFFQMLSATAAIFRANVRRAISARIPFCVRPSRYLR